jgi:hypothetical protein
MAIITTAGGSGTTSTSVGSLSGTNLTLFTTPNTTNAIFLVNVLVAGATTGAGAYDLAYPQSIANMKVGPNTTVYVPLWNNFSSAAYTYYVSYNYCSCVTTGTTITTAGGSGTATSGALTQLTGTNVSLFTTPNTTNAEFHVSILIAGSTEGTGAYPAPYPRQTLNMKVGPNTAVSAPVFNNYSSGTKTYYLCYHWCSTVI